MTTRRSVPVPPGGEPLELRTDDGLRLSAIHMPGPGDTALLVVHGFAGSWSQQRVDVIVRRLSARAPVIAIDQRGHGQSEGMTTIGHREPLDVEAASRWARERGYARVVTIGFSMGSAVVLRHAALRPRTEGHAGADAVVAVSGPAFWYYKGTPPMRWLHRGIASAAGRAYIRMALGARVDPRPWPDPPPMSPTQAASRVSDMGIPLLIVHGNADPFFPVDHPIALHEAAAGSQLWLEEGFGHAEGAISADLVDRIGTWATPPPMRLGYPTGG